MIAYQPLFCSALPVAPAVDGATLCGVLLRIAVAVGAKRQDVVVTMLPDVPAMTSIVVTSDPAGAPTARSRA